MQDIPAIAAAAHDAGALVMMDNTWASPLYCKPFTLGVDVSIQAATKYIVGHSDVMMGTITTNESAWRATIKNHGLSASPLVLTTFISRSVASELCPFASKGIWRLACSLPNGFQDRPEVSRVLHPALPTDPGHEIWKRDFSGASGLFGVVLKSTSDEAVAAMLNDMELFGMGYSWGGYESLIIPADPTKNRTATTWAPEGPLIRIHAGLEDPEDLIADLEAGLTRLANSA